MRFLCRLGSTTENRSQKVWPLIDEAIQCYHGDIEFQEMLVAVIAFSEGKLADEVAEELKSRMAFDAKSVPLKSLRTFHKRQRDILRGVSFVFGAFS